MKFQAIRACAQSASLLAILLAASFAAAAQLTPQTDPANLAGERVSPQDLADTLPIDHGAPALQQLLRKLRTRASFMLIVAHPDDEDGGMLTYLSRGQGARVAMLTLNRGEGGQNLMSADFEDALGLIRTQEILAADRYMAVDQFFGTEVDFGFSKTKEEAFAKWTHERVLYDAVRAVRLYRPLVIGSVFIGAASDGHGQHQVSGQIAQEVFNAAGDPKVFPEMGLPPWQPLKVYARIPFARIDAQGMFDYATNQYTPARFINYVTGKVTTTVPKANVVVPEGTPDPLLGGLTYLQFARQGLALQKSQIGHNARLASPGRFDVSYHRYGSHPNQPDGDDSALESGFFEGIDTSLPGIATLAPSAPPKLKAVLQLIDMHLSDAQRQFDPANPASVAEPLRIALQTLDTVISGTEGSTLSPTEKFNLLHELRIKRVQLNNALLLALGISVKARTLRADEGDVVLNAQPSIAGQLEVSVSGSQPAQLKAFSFIGPNESIAGTTSLQPSDTAITKGGIYAIGHKLKVAGLAPTRPYFSRPDIEQPFYDISDPRLRNAPVTPAPFVVHTEFSCSGVSVFADAIVAKYSETQTAEPVLIVPPVSVSLDRHAAILAPQQKTVHAFAIVRSDDAIQQLGGVNLFLEQRSGAKGVSLGTFMPEEYSKVIGKDEQIGVQADANKLGGQTSTLVAVVSQNGHDYAEGYRPVGYPGLTYTNYYTPATVKVVPVDVHTAPNLNIAYLPGTGDDVPAALEQLGIHPHIITAADLAPEALKPYDAVILGVRAYETHPELAAANPALNTYAANGGVVIAQYNTGNLPAGTGPYPLSLGDSEKVVEEDAPVQILTPENPLLTWPNHITAADFDNWIEERGHGFMGNWDAHYAALLETHDTGQQPQRGGLLVARAGKGAWIYLGLALYRQLPEGVPGSYRLLANLISAAKNPAFLSTPSPKP
jgi:LmbE family N-acetylglucosaminyl deacetylase